MGMQLVPALARSSVVAFVLTAALGCQSSTPTPEPSVGSVTITVPVPITDKAVISAAAEVLSARLRALGLGPFTVAIGESMVFTLPADPPPDQARIRAAFAAPGSVAFLPVPFANGAPASGAAAPAGIEPLFDAAGQVTSAAVVDSDGAPSIEIDLGGDAAKALAQYSSTHVGDYLILVLDGSVLMSPMLQGSIPDGRLLLSMAPDDRLPYAPEVLAAILASGPLPAGWP